MRLKYFTEIAMSLMVVMAGAGGCGKDTSNPILYRSLDEETLLSRLLHPGERVMYTWGTSRVRGVMREALGFPRGREACALLGWFDLPEEDGTLAMWLKPQQMEQQKLYYVLTKASHAHGPTGLAFTLVVLRDGRMRLQSEALGLRMAESKQEAIRFGKWQHVAVSWGLEGVSFYIDAIKVPTTTKNGIVRAVQNNGMAVCLGSIWDAYDPETNYRGAIDELRVYDRLLFEEEIAAVARWTR